MLDIKYIREHTAEVQDSIKKRGAKADLKELLKLDEKRRKLMTETEQLRAQQKESSVGVPTQEQVKQLRELSKKHKEKEKELKILTEQYEQILYKIPNILLPDVPVGKDESENIVVRTVGKPKNFDFQIKDHVDIGEHLGIIDIKTAAEVSGARFAYLQGAGALLQFALVNFCFSLLMDQKQLKKIAEAVKPGYDPKVFVPIIPPVMIRPEIFTKMARLSEDDKNERYYLPTDDLYLVGSAEHTLGPIHMNQTLDENRLPLRYLGYSTSFRREAGSYGKDTKGILRVHQFDKLEMESFTTPENSQVEQDFLVAIQEKLLQLLELPYQVVQICTGDIGAPDARQIDIETWIPSQGRYRETHTSDLMTDYQTRRLKTTVKRKDGSKVFAHTNDATAFAIGRTLVAILENYQQKDGSVLVPKILQQYMGGLDSIEA